MPAELSGVVVDLRDRVEDLAARMEKTQTEIAAELRTIRDDLDRFDLIGLNEVAELFGVSVNTAKQWRQRRESHGQRIPFPEPDTYVSGRATWARRGVLEWGRATGRLTK